MVTEVLGILRPRNIERGISWIRELKSPKEPKLAKPQIFEETVKFAVDICNAMHYANVGVSRENDALIAQTKTDEFFFTIRIDPYFSSNLDMTQEMQVERRRTDNRTLVDVAVIKRVKDIKGDNSIDKTLASFVHKDHVQTPRGIELVLREETRTGRNKIKEMLSHLPKIEIPRKSFY